jgi:uncharacterized protein
MSNRDHYPHGVPCWVDTAQPDLPAALDFYGALLGWEFAGPGPVPGDPPGEYHVARVRGRDVAGISSLPPSAPATPSWATHVAVQTADGTADRARAAGGTVIVEPFDAPPAGRMAVLSDPAGAAFCVWEAGERQGAQVLNEPSAWAMSALNTGDPDAAKAFYRALFGWEAEPFGAGMELFRLPGYVGGEAQQPVRATWLRCWRRVRPMRCGTWTSGSPTRSRPPLARPSTEEAWSWHRVRSPAF